MATGLGEDGKQVVPKNLKTNLVRMCQDSSVGYDFSHTPPHRLCPCDVMHMAWCGDVCVHVIVWWRSCD